RPISVFQNRLGQAMPAETGKEIPMQEIVERYIASWNETDPQRRRKMVDELWANQASYIDPLAEAHGCDAIDAVIAAAQAQFPGLWFRVAGPGGRSPPPGRVHRGPGARRRRAAGHRVRRRRRRRGRPAADRPRLPGQGAGLSAF